MNAKKILIVDDDKDLLRGLNFRLRASGYGTPSLRGMVIRPLVWPRKKSQT